MGLLLRDVFPLKVGCRSCIFSYTTILLRILFAVAAFGLPSSLLTTSGIFCPATLSLLTMFSLLTAAALAASTLTTIVSAVPVESKIARRTSAPKIAVYYGQGENQLDIENFCNDDNIDIIPVGFVNRFPSMKDNNGWPSWNFGNQCWGTPLYEDTKMYMYCDVGSWSTQIQACQAKGKKILLSIGGEVDGSDPYILESKDVDVLATELWQIFGPKPASWDGPRPFGNAVVDGFDFDIEGAASDAYGQLANKLREKMNGDGYTSNILTAAPQCVVPDASLASAIMAASFDYLFIQFYNTPQCSARSHLDKSYGTDISYNDWVSWLTANSHGRPSNLPQIFIGLPGSPAATVDGYMYLDQTDASKLLKDFCDSPLFAGVMVWEATAAFGNNDYVGQIAQALEVCPSRATTTTTTTTIATTTTRSSTTTVSVSDIANVDLTDLYRPQRPRPRARPPPPPLPGFRLRLQLQLGLQRLLRQRLLPQRLPRHLPLPLPRLLLL